MTKYARTYDNTSDSEDCCANSVCYSIGVPISLPVVWVAVGILPMRLSSSSYTYIFSLARS
jgi:hypothetical protein